VSATALRPSPRTSAFDIHSSNLGTSVCSPLPPVYPSQNLVVVVGAAGAVVVIEFFIAPFSRNFRGAIVA